MASNIPHIMFVLGSSDLAGGATTGLFQLLKFLPRDRYRAYLVLPEVPRTDDEQELKQVVAEIATVDMGGGWIKNSRRGLRGWLSEGAQHLRTLFHLRPQMRLRELIKRWSVDLVYTNGTTLIDGAIAARLSGCPHVWHIKERIGKGENTEFYLPDSLAVSAIAGLSSRIVAMSNFVAEPFSQHSGTGKLRVIHDGVDLASFKLDGSGRSLRQRLGVPEDELLVGNVGVIRPLKRPDMFVQTAALLKGRVPKVRFVHFGRVPEPSNHDWNYYKYLRSLITESGLEKHFIWGGVIQNIPEMMTALDVLVHTCDQEGFGRIAIEAMAAQKPVIGPSRGGIAESVVHGETGFVSNPRDPAAFAAATERLLRNPDLRRQMGVAGRARVEKHFSIEQHVKTVLELLDMVSHYGKS